MRTTRRHAIAIMIALATLLAIDVAPRAQSRSSGLGRPRWGRAARTAVSC